MNARLPETEYDERQTLIDRLSAWGIDASVLEAMWRVPREKFVPPRLKSMAYVDSALPIDCGQTISQGRARATRIMRLRLRTARRRRFRRCVEITT